MTLLAFLMSKGRCMEPFYWSSIPYLYGVMLTAPVPTWFLIRWNKWSRVLGCALVLCSVAIAMDALRIAAGSGILSEYGIDFHFLLPCFGAAILPVAAATAAFVLPKRKPTVAAPSRP